MSARCAKALVEGGPQRRFAYFAAAGPAPQGGVPEAKQSFFVYFFLRKK